MTIPPIGSRPMTTSQYEIWSRAPGPSTTGQLTIAASVTGGSGFAAGLRVAGPGAGVLVVEAGGLAVGATSTPDPVSAAIRMKAAERMRQSPMQARPGALFTAFPARRR